MAHWFRVLLVAVIIFALPKGLSQPTRVALIHIPKVMTFDDNNAPYTKLLNNLNNAELAIEGIYLPSARANKLLNEKKVDCIFPIIPAYNRTVQTKFSEPVNGIRAHLFSINNKPFKSLDELSGRSVVYLRGYLFADIFNRFQQVNFLPVNSQQSAYMMLKKQRVDAYLEYIPDIRYALSSEQVSNLSYDKQHPVIKDSDRMECLDSELGRLFLQRFNRQIQELKKTGKLEKILGNYYVDSDLD